MIQRSPTYVVSGPSEDAINKFLKKNTSSENHIFFNKMEKYPYFKVLLSLWQENILKELKTKF